MSEQFEYEDVNPDPARYRQRLEPTLRPEVAETLGIIESWWEPREVGAEGDEGDEGESDDDDETEAPARSDGSLWRKPTLALRDLDGYMPLQLVFDRPPMPPGRDFNDDWYDALLRALQQLIANFSTQFFGAVSAGAGNAQAAGVDPDPDSPWGEELPTAFLLYCSDIARQDDHDGGWDALLLDPVQRAALVRGVLIKLLDEHVLSALLFGGTASQAELLSHWDRSTLEADGYARKLKRCEELQRFLGQDTLTADFWAHVDAYTAQAAQMLLPLVNMQRRMAIKASRAGGVAARDAAPPGPGIRTFYQQLHDIVALAGYASLNMARSVSIFQLDFPEVGQMWEVDQDREADDAVYRSSVRKARAADTRTTLAGDYDGDGDGDGRQAPMRADKIKIVTWPRITRYKPDWSRGRDTVKSATRTILHKSRNLYYHGVVGGGSTHGPDDEDDSEAHAARAADAEDVQDLNEHVQQVRAARRAARQRQAAWTLARWSAAAYLLFLLWTALPVWHREGARAAQERLADHAGMLAACAVAACRAAADAAQAARGRASHLAGQLVAEIADDIVEPARAAILGAVQRGA